MTVRDPGGNEGSLLVTVSVTDTNESPVVADWYNASWDQRKVVTIDHTQVSDSLKDFPLLISLVADADLAAAAQASGQTSGDDILFTSADGATKLAHEIEHFDGVTGELRVWVKTDLSATQDTVLYLYYGNAAAGSQQDPTNVWDSDFVGVWHLDEAPDSDGLTKEILDSTVNVQHGSAEGLVGIPSQTDAKIGKGIDFDSADQGLIRMTDSAVLDATAAAGTFELWIKYDYPTDTDYQIVISSSNRFSGTDGYEWESQGDDDHFFYPWGGTNSNYSLGPDPFANSQWHHLAVSFDYDQLDTSIYVDGTEMSYTEEQVPTFWTALADPADWLWGGNPEKLTRYIDAVMDEIRVSSTDRSLAWIQTSYANQNDPAAFVTIGSEQPRALPVAEDAVVNTTVGFAWGFGDDGDTLTYELVGGNFDNAFKINPTTGEIQVNDPSAIDHQTRDSYFLAVRVTDAEGVTDIATVQIAVTDVVTDLSSGIDLNTDGGNDAYLVSASGLAQSLDATTVEIRFAAGDLPTETVFMSFNNGPNDEFMLQLVDPTGALEIDFGGAAEVSSTAVDYATLLLDGALHTLSVSWDKVNGDWAVFIDGDLIDSGTGLGPGAPLDTTNGRFVFGQEQDSLLGGFDPTQYFSGTLYDVRIWDHARTPEDIALSYQRKFDATDLPNGLVANWQMDGFNGSNEVIDVVSGNNLSIGRAGAGFTASSPVVDLNIDENSANGTRVGFVVPSSVTEFVDVVSDGNFTSVDPVGNTTYYADGSGAGSVIGDWTVSLGSVDQVVDVDMPPLGGNAIDLSGNETGAITQTLNTVAGK